MKAPNAKRLMEMFNLLLDHFGPQHWWPGETALEIIVGAVLTQNTSWKNVEKAIQNLKRKGLLSLEELHRLSASALAPEIRSAGFYNLKANRLRGLIDFIMVRYEGDLPRMLKEDPGALRESLLSAKGIGRETADSILLYAAQAPVFVIDAYTHRILHRHGMAGEEATYEELQSLFMDNLPEDPALFNEFHALIVCTGKDYCRKEPRCALCPLRHWGPAPPRP
ncbi:MAG: endonuclease III domain-containing protein [Thermodesulfobacteriota bacterium]